VEIAGMRLHVRLLNALSDFLGPETVSFLFCTKRWCWVSICLFILVVLELELRASPLLTDAPLADEEPRHRTDRQVPRTRDRRSKPLAIFLLWTCEI
jgi:hypothetical protein